MINLDNYWLIESFRNQHSRNSLTETPDNYREKTQDDFLFHLWQKKADKT